jgi:hypothetical protein
MKTEAALNLSVLKQLLEKIGMAPGKSFFDDGVLYYSSVPAFEDLSRLRFLFGREISFREAAADRVSALLKHWRAELSPRFEEDTDDVSTLLEGAED